MGISIVKGFGRYIGDAVKIGNNKRSSSATVGSIDIVLTVGAGRGIERQVAADFLVHPDQEVPVEFMLVDIRYADTSAIAVGIGHPVGCDLLGVKGISIPGYLTLQIEPVKDIIFNGKPAGQPVAAKTETTPKAEKPKTKSRRLKAIKPKDGVNSKLAARAKGNHPNKSKKQGS